MSSVAVSLRFVCIGVTGIVCNCRLLEFEDSSRMKCQRVALYSFNGHHEDPDTDMTVGRFPPFGFPGALVEMGVLVSRVPGSPLDLGSAPVLLFLKWGDRSFHSLEDLPLTSPAPIIKLFKDRKPSLQKSLLGLRSVDLLSLIAVLIIKGFLFLRSMHPFLLLTPLSCVCFLIFSIYCNIWLILMGF